MLKKLSTLALLVAAGLPAFAGTGKPAPRKTFPAPVKVTSVEGITEYRLHNGLQVLLFPDPSKPTITVNVTYKVGSRHENYGETGMAHLLEHLVFKGSPRHKNIPQELTSHGANPNGSTWFDRTNYFETFADSDENLNWALDLEADRMVNSFIAKSDLDSEMTVVRNEFESGENNPAAVLEERVMSTAYLWHNYGNTTIGARADLENVPIDRLQAFYRNWYQPDNAVLIVAGKIDEAKTLALIQKYFAPIPRPTRKLQATYTAEPVQDGERQVTLRRVGDVQVVMALYHSPPASHPDAAAVEVLSQVLADTPAGRLHKALVETKKASSVGGYMMPTQEPGFMSFSAEVLKEASLEAARAAMMATLDEAAVKAFTAEEVNRIKVNLLKQAEQTLNNSNRLGIGLSESIAVGDWRLFFLQRDWIKKVTPEDVARVAAAYLKPSNRTVGLFIPDAAPQRSEIPAAPDIAALLKDYKGEALVETGEAFDPSPANIEARTQRKTLSNGMQLALLTKKTRGATVQMSLALNYGDEKGLFGKRGDADGAGQMLMRGTTKHSRQQLQDEFDRLKARVSVNGAAEGARASFETTRANLPAVMRLVAEVLREPAFPESEFEQLRNEALAYLEQQRSEPDAMASNLYQRHLDSYPKGDVRYTMTPEEEIAEAKSAKLAAAQSFHKSFYGADHGQLALVGDFDAAEIAALAEELFGNWRSPAPYVRVPRAYQSPAPLHKTLEAPDKAQAFFIAGMNLNVRDDDPDYPALVLGNYMLGGGFLSSRLAARIRGKDGLSYGVGSQLSAGPFDADGNFTAFAIYAPENGEKLEAAFKEEIEKALKDGFTETEIKEAKSGILQQRQMGRAQDGRLAGRLADYMKQNRTLAWDAEFEAKMNSLTAEQLVTALRKHLDPAKISIIKAGDFKGAAAKTPAKAPVINTPAQ